MSLLKDLWSVVVHRTVLELHSQTELQRSAEQLKQLRLDLKHQMSLYSSSAGALDKYYLVSQYLCTINSHGLTLLTSFDLFWLSAPYCQKWLTVLLLSRFWLLCCDPAPETRMTTRQPSLSRAARPGVVSRRFSVGAKSAGVSILEVKRCRGLVSPVVGLSVRPAVRDSERWLWKWRETWRLALKSTSQHALRTETSCRCSVSEHAASVWTPRGKQWLLGQQGALSPVRHHTNRLPERDAGN